MPSSLLADQPVSRRALLGAGLALAAAPRWAAADAGSEALLRQGGVVIAFRHALAPGTFDPPGFRLGDCGTQRNLSDEGRGQARRAGAWFRARGLQPARVRSSPWCRCIDSATLAFAPPEVWPALGSPHGMPETTGERHLQALRQALADAAAQPGRFEAWFTHMFVLSDLAGVNVASAEGLVLAPGSGGMARVLARWELPA